MEILNILRKTKKNSYHVGSQRDGRFCGDLGRCKETLRLLLVGVKLGKIPPTL